MITIPSVVNKRSANEHALPKLLRLRLIGVLL
jgi:hypothetical protein